jgi:hypothetical protein
LCYYHRVRSFTLPGPMFWPGRGGKQSGRRAVISSSQSSCTSYCKSMNRGTAGRGASPHMQSSHQVEESPLGMQLLRSSPSCSSALSAPAFHFQSSSSTFSPRSTQTIRLRTHPPARITEPKQPRGRLDRGLNNENTARNTVRRDRPSLGDLR